MFEFDGVTIKNTINHEYYDCRNIQHLQNLTDDLNKLHLIFRTYEDAIHLNKKLYTKGLQDTELSNEYKDQLKIKIEALTELKDKIELILKSEGLL